MCGYTVYLNTTGIYAVCISEHPNGGTTASPPDGVIVNAQAQGRTLGHTPVQVESNYPMLGVGEMTREDMPPIDGANNLETFLYTLHLATKMNIYKN